MANNNSKSLALLRRFFHMQQCFSQIRHCFRNTRLLFNAFLVHKSNLATIWDQVVQLDFVMPNTLYYWLLMVVGRGVVGQTKEASTVQLQLPFPWTALGRRKNRNTSCFSFVMPTPHAKGTHHFGSFQDLTDWPIWQEQVHVVVESHAIFQR